MSGMSNNSGSATDRADPLRASTATADAEGLAPAENTSAAAEAPDSPAPLTSLTSLLGGTIEAGTSCAADGTCD